MSNLLENMGPFNKYMDRFIILYRQVNNILKLIRKPGFGHEVERDEWREAAQRRGYTRDQESKLLEDFVNISEILTSDSNEKGSIDYILQVLKNMEREDQFTFLTNSRLINAFDELKNPFEISISELKKNLNYFLENANDGTNDSIFIAPGDVDPEEVTQAIDNYNNFIKFLTLVAKGENLENNARGRRKSRRLKKSKRGKKSKKHPKSKKHLKSKKSRKTKKKK